MAPIGDIDLTIPWSDAHGFMPRPYNNIDERCTWCGQPLRQHYVGGSHYHPIERSALWMWEDS